jgi:hypothetical protein
LENSLRQAVLIALDMRYQQAVLADPRNLHLHRFGAPDQPLPPGTSISRVFDSVQGELLILGAPGAGKTTMLLELTSDLPPVADASPRRKIWYDGGIADTET